MPVKPGLTQVEQDKLNIDPDFDFREDIAKRPFNEIPNNEIGMFKWTGIYHQLQKGFFMLRLRLPGGLITSDQLRRAAELADQYAQGQLCITTRMTLQFHWLRKEDLYKVLEGMEEVGINSRNACGDVTRNVVTCSLQGVCPHEVGDVRPVIDGIADDPELLNEQRNFPRKHKVSVNGCGRSCGQTLMNCQSWHPVRRFDEAGHESIGYKYFAGGGLGARPVLAKLIFDWVPEGLVVEVTKAAAEVFNREGNRRKRAYARLKMVVDRLGPEKYGEMVLDVMRERGLKGLAAIEMAEDPTPRIGRNPYVGDSVVAQRQEGFSVVRAIILRSELTADDARQFAAWADAYGNGDIMLTARQNLDLRFVPNDKVAELVAQMHAKGYRTDGHDLLPDMVACVGTTQCNLAVSDTPNTYRRLYDAFADDVAFWKSIGPLRIHMNGCPNSCAQHWIADIGLRGNRSRDGEGSEEGFGVFVGGTLSEAGHVAEHVCDVGATDVAAVMRRLLELYLAHRADAAETFGDYARRVGGKGLGDLLDFETLSLPPANIRNVKLEPVFRQAFDEVLTHGK